jgi:uncharacterized protein
VNLVSYLDASAIVKLVIFEAESTALQAYVDSAGRLATSRLGEIEVRRAVARLSAHDPQRLEQILHGIELVELDPSIGIVAAAARPESLRTLDAIHLATALEFAGEIGAFVTYDPRLADAARAHGLQVVSPG